MTSSKLSQIEEARKRHFSGLEIRELLQKDHQTGEYSNLQQYYQENTAALEAQYGKENALEGFRKDLEQRLRNIKDLLYYKRLEDGLSNSVQVEIDERSDQVRGQIEGILGHKTVLSNEELLELRSSDIAHFYSRTFRVDDQFLADYRDLVRFEVQQQLKMVSQLEASKAALEQEQSLRDVYERAEFLLDFIVTHIPRLQGDQAYLKTFLLRKLRSTEGAQLVKKLYQDIAAAVGADSPSACQEMIQTMSTRLQVNAVLEKKQQIKAIITEQAPDLNIPEEDLDRILERKKRGGKPESYLVNHNGISYHELLGRHLEEIESALFDITLEKMLADDERSSLAVEAHVQRIKMEVAGLQRTFQHFHRQHYTLGHVIKQQQSWLSATKQKHLLSAVRTLRAIRGEEAEEGSSMTPKMLETLLALSNEEEVDAFITQARAEVRAFLIEDGVPEKHLDDVERLDPLFDLLDYAIARSKSAADVTIMAEDLPEEESPEELEDNSPIITDQHILGQIQEYLEEMEGYCNRKCAHPGDGTAFNAAELQIKRLMKGQVYQTGAQEGEGLQQATKPKMLPYEMDHRLTTLKLLRQEEEQYGDLNTVVGTDIIEKLNNPSNLRQAMEALYGSAYDVPRERAALKKLSQVMTLDHPVTCVWFNAADQEPFYNDGVHQIHRVPNQREPATFRDRAQHLMKRVKECVDYTDPRKPIDFLELKKLFQPGEVADRLFIDASFFPINKIRKKDQQIEVLYDPITEKGPNGEKRITGWELSTERIAFERDREFFKKKYEKLSETFDANRDLPKLEDQAECLMHHTEHLGTFQLFTDEERQEQEVEAITQFQSSIRTDDDGNVSIDEAALDQLAAYAAAGGQVESLGIRSTSGGMTRERMEKLAKDYPLVARRMMQTRSMFLGGAIGGPEAVLRWGGGKAVVAAATPLLALRVFWKDLNWYSPQHIYMAINEMVDKITDLADFRVRIGSYDLLQKVFDGTLVGNEFAKLYQGEEDKRVNEFKDAMKDYGHDQVIQRLYTASDQFELKAAFLEGTDRGILTLEDFLDPRLFKLLNRYTTSIRLPLHKKEDMLQNADLQFKTLDTLREAIDDIWGEGTWQTWRSNNSSKYESEKQTAMKNFEGNSVREKDRWYRFYWDLLKTDQGRAKLRKMHPAEIAGNIEQDMLQGDRDCGETFGIMQAMISWGFVKLDHVRRLQTAHSNDLPIHALLEPEEAEVAGLTTFVKACTTKYTWGEGNPLIDFYQGKKAIHLKAMRMDGKWRFPKTHKDAKALGSEHQEVVITVHQLQKNREAQPEWHRKMDNCCIGIFTPCYSWNQIESALNPNTQGKIEARSHDIIAAYRGIHQEFASYMESMSNGSLMKDAKTFKRQIWHAYEALCKTQAYAAFMTRHIDRSGRNLDYNMNTLDGSPNFSSSHQERRMQSKTNFETLLLGTDGPHQRMAESSAHLDSLDGVISNDLRIKFKEMAGFQFVKSLGINSANGKKDPNSFEPYDYRNYNPAEKWREVMPLFMENVIALADKHGYGAEIRASLGRSKMGDLAPGNNDDRQRALNHWMHDEAGL